MRLKVVYICHPIKGNVAANVERVKWICQDILQKNKLVIPFAPYLGTLRYLDDTVPDQRSMGMELNERAVAVSDELWVCSALVSDGMLEEIETAKTLYMPVVHKEEYGATASISEIF